VRVVVRVRLVGCEHDVVMSCAMLCGSEVVCCRGLSNPSSEMHTPAPLPPPLTVLLARPSYRVALFLKGAVDQDTGYSDHHGSPRSLVSTTVPVSAVRVTDNRLYIVPVL